MKLLKFLFSLIFIFVYISIYSINAQTDVTDTETFTEDTSTIAIPTDLFTDTTDITDTTSSITDTDIIYPTIPTTPTIDTSSTSTTTSKLTANTITITSTSVSTATVSHTTSLPSAVNFFSIESNNYYVFSATSHPLEKIIVRLVEDIDTRDNDQLTCYEQDLHLLFDVKNEIKEFNFCQNSTWQRDLIQIFPLFRDFVMITYLDNSNSNGVYLEKGMVLNLNLTNGTSILTSEITLGSINMTEEQDVKALGHAVVNEQPEREFIWVNRVGTNKEFVKWTTFNITDRLEGIVGNSNSTSSNTFNVSSNEDLKVIRTVDGGYGFIIAGKVDDDSLYPWKISVRFLRPQKNVISLPFLLYQREDDVKSIKIEYCDNSQSEPGIECIFSINTNSDLIYIRIEFVIINQIFQVRNKYIVSGYYENNDTLTFTGKIYNNNGDFISNWNLPEVNAPSYRISSSLLPLSNDTIIPTTIIPHGSFFSEKIWMVCNYNNISNRWNLSIADLSSINPGYQYITIEFDRSITLSVGNITICQIKDNFKDQNIIVRNNIMFGRRENSNVVNNKYYYIRQTLNAQSSFVTKVNDTSVKVTVLNSTFIAPNKNYFVIIDNDFVRDSNYDEPLSGLERPDWKFTTEDDDSFGIKTSGLVRLTTLASRKFYEFSKSDRTKFLDDLKNELTEILLLNDSILRASEHWQWDPNVKNWQILLKLTIYPGGNKTTDVSVGRIVDSLNESIINRDVSLISQYSNTSLLDSSYGFVKKQSVWDRYGFKLIGIGIAFLIIGVLALLSFKKRKDKTKTGYLLSGYLPFKLFLIILDFSIDVEAFSLIHSRLAGLSIFSAPFSADGESLLFWACAVNFVIEDTPQLVIQIVYIASSVNYDIVPFLNLISASTLFLVIVLGHLYKLYRYLIDDRNDVNNIDGYEHYNNPSNDSQNEVHHMEREVGILGVSEVAGIGGVGGVGGTGGSGGVEKGKRKIVGGMGVGMDELIDHGTIEVIETSPEGSAPPVRSWQDPNPNKAFNRRSSQPLGSQDEILKYTIGPQGRVVRKKTGSLGVDLSENLDNINGKRRSKDNAGVVYMPTDIANIHIEDEITTDGIESNGLNSRHFYDGLPGHNLDVNNVPSISITSPTSNVIDIDSSPSPISPIPINSGIPFSSNPSS
ncbi:7816_t:CDS:10 [Diversispora eburnea]|uniref:7816_t:CDS:1 n=1 Tax=Diversispora eburnea TaxID=1213867 RepID=A0A9N9FPV5_9GLOM|nr:7816_t:CDS:10 [Diversispora eburnea]